MSSLPQPAEGQMVAFRFIPGATGGASVSRDIIPIPTPNPDQVLVKVLAAGVCHSDCSILDPEFQKGMFAMPNPFVLGHEGSGKIVSLGSNVKDESLQPGTFVSLLGTNPCLGNSCEACSVGLDNSCSVLPYMGFGLDGFFASYVVIAAKDAVPVPASTTEISPAVAAISTDAVLTPYHSLVTHAQITAEQTILIIGAGGLGLNAIQLAKNVIGVNKVVVSDIREESVKQALAVGADYACHPDDLEALVKEHKFVFDTVVDVVGNNETFNVSLSRVRIGGTIQIVGLSVREISIPTVATAMKNVTVKMSTWGCRRELEASLKAVSEGKIVPQVEERPMEECLSVLQDLATGKIKNRIALIPA